MKKLILGIFLLSPAIAIGQVQTYFNMGYGQFKMSDMKAYQNDLNSAAIVPTKTTSSFPAFWIYDWGATYTTHSNVLTGLSLDLDQQEDALRTAITPERFRPTNGYSTYP